ncbi:protein kinase domain-containing protein [Kribbella sp. NBC_00359]|uniref:protein kinase domain-containing protein n=1 Tax=Kribbella sp. NBC_00359 TaxID=2975966 RepID=UPI002E220842
MDLDIAGYSLRKKLGSGSAGAVWQVRDLATGRNAVLKRIPITAIPDQEKFREDIAILQRIRHPHIARLLEVRETGTDWLLITQYVVAGSLTALRTRRGPLSPGELVTLLTPLAEALDHLHRSGLTHGSPTPTDTLFDADGRPVLTDAALHPGSPTDDLRALATIAHQAGGDPTTFTPDLFTTHNLPSRLLTLAAPEPIDLAYPEDPTTPPTTLPDTIPTPPRPPTTTKPPTTDDPLQRSRTPLTPPPPKPPTLQPPQATTPRPPAPTKPLPKPSRRPRPLRRPKLTRRTPTPPPINPLTRLTPPTPAPPPPHPTTPPPASTPPPTSTPPSTSTPPQAWIPAQSWTPVRTSPPPHASTPARTSTPSFTAPDTSTPPFTSTPPQAWISAQARPPAPTLPPDASTPSLTSTPTQAWTPAAVQSASPTPTPAPAEALAPAQTPPRDQRPAHTPTSALASSPTAASTALVTPTMPNRPRTNRHPWRRTYALWSRLLHPRTSPERRRLPHPAYGVLAAAALGAVIVLAIGIATIGALNAPTTPTAATNQPTSPQTSTHPTTPGTPTQSTPPTPTQPAIHTTPTGPASSLAPSLPTTSPTATQPTTPPTPTRPATPQSTIKPPTTTSRTDAARWALTLQDLDAQRAHAFWTLNPEVLDKIYVPGSPPWLADRALLASYLKQNVRIQGLRIQIDKTIVTHQTPTTITLKTTDHLSAGQAIDHTGTTTPLPPGTPTTRLITLTTTRTTPTWRITTITPA